MIRLVVIFISLLWCSAISQPGEFRGSIHVYKNADIDSALLVGKKPLSTNPLDVAVWDSANDTLKRFPIDSISSDSVAHADHADSSDTAAYAHLAQRSLGVKLNFASNIVPLVRDLDSVLSDTYQYGVYPDTGSSRMYYTTNNYSTSALDGDWGPKLTMYSGVSTLYNSAYFGVMTLGNGYAGTRAAIELRNFSTVAFGRERALISWRKRDATSSSHNDLEVLTYSTPSASGWIRHIFINGETGEVIFQDSCPDPNRTTRYPARFRNGGIRTTYAKIDTTPAIPSPTVALVKSPTGDTVGQRNIDSLDVDSARTSGNVRGIYLSRRNDTTVIHFSATDSLCLKAVAP